MTVSWEENCEEAHESKSLKYVEDWEKQQNGHPAGYGTAETICAESRDLLISGLATSADPPMKDVMVYGRNIR